MAFGLEIRDSSGRIFATPETPCMHFIKKMYFNANKGLNTFELGVSSEIHVACYLRINRMVEIHSRQIPENGSWIMSLRAKSQVDGFFYIFTSEIPPDSELVGIEMYNENGARVFSTAAKPLQNKTVVMDKDSMRKVKLSHPAATIAIPQIYWWRKFGNVGILNLETPCAYDNVIELGNMGAGLTGSWRHDLPYLPNGNVVNYINSALYD